MFAAPLSRRALLQYGVLTGGLLALSRVPVRAAGDLAPGENRLQVLSPYEAQIFSAVGERMVASDDPAMPKFGDTQAIVAIDQAVLQLDGSLQTQLKVLLRLVQWGPPLLICRFIPFTRMGEELQDEYLRDWAGSGNQVRMLGFRALKNLSMLGYYAQDEVWPAIHYRGPWAPRPRKLITI